MSIDRKPWYGEGKQPWDDIVEQSWAPQFAAGNVVKYLRRTKDPVHSLESAKWYYARLHEMDFGPNVVAALVMAQLMRLLTPEEHFG